MPMELDFVSVVHLVELGVFSGVAWYLKKHIDRQTHLLEKTHTDLVQLKSEHDTYKSLGGCPLMGLAKPE